MTILQGKFEPFKLYPEVCSAFGPIPRKHPFMRSAQLLTKIRARLLRLYQIVMLQDPTLTDEERKFSQDWVKRHVIYFDIPSTTLASLILVASTIPIYKLAPEPPRNIQIAVHLILGIFLFIYQFYARKKRFLQWIPLMLTFVCVGGYTLAIHEVFSRSVTVKDGIILSSIYSTIVTFSIILYPYSGPWVLAAGLFYFVSAAVLFTHDYNGIGGPWLATTAVQIGFAINVFYGRLARMHREALHELRTRNLIAVNEKLKREALEKDMALAQQIQDSFSPPQAFNYSDVKIDFFQQKYDLLGGDWYAMKKSPSGELTILVADATGKSVSAALVIHAVQSLWALSLDDPTFDPQKWILGVNKSLYALGQKSTHSLTLALAHLKGATLTYYSAGHVPLVIVREEQGKRTLKFLQARGDILGIAPDIRLQPAFVDLKKEHVKTILFATDGIIDKGSRTDREYLDHLLTALDLVGAKALDECPAEDDKLLVRLELAA